MNGWVTDYVAGLWLAEFDTAWFSLHVQDPGRSGALESEAVGGSYKRMLGVFSSVDARTIWLDQAILWTGLPALIISHIGVWDAERNGHMTSAALLPPPFPQV